MHHDGADTLMRNVKGFEIGIDGREEKFARWAGSAAKARLWLSQILKEGEEEPFQMVLTRGQHHHRYSRRSLGRD